MTKLNDQQKSLLAHVSCQFGWHGGMGDPPSDGAVLAIARGTIEFMEEKTGLFLRDRE
ncbi:hypothetical protein LCGC14_1391320 [marine sediment metagenome]|uniref:Uncharacterized protein n=1 Tax=marine sediment metagenome TaxID=412755 RepID=A0A0F9HF69_9ZZZZ